MPHVFISYLREDTPAVDRLAQELSARGIRVWVDRKEINPGENWKIAIQQAIEGGAHFIACFSSSYKQRQRTHMNEELTLAIEEQRQRPLDRPWFIPVLLDKCEVPYRLFGASQNFRDIQRIDLSENWEDGIDRIVETIQGKATVAAGVPPKAPEDSRSIGTIGEPIETSETRPSSLRLLVGMIALTAVLLTGSIVWQGYVQSRKTDADRCRGAFKVLRELDDSYDYGSCSLAEVTDDDSARVDEIESVLRSVAGCDPELANVQRIDFYRKVQEHLRDVTSVCESPENAGPEGVWLRLHCLQYRPNDPDLPATAKGAANWAKLAVEFENLVPIASEPMSGPLRGRLQDCAAISRAFAYSDLAAITGRPEATDHMLAAVNAIRRSDELSVVQLAASGLAEYMPFEPRPWAKGELEQANETLRTLLSREAEKAVLWQSIVPGSHRQLWFTAMGVVVDRMAQIRSKGREQEDDYRDSVQRLESELLKANQREASEFLSAKREAMKGDWYGTTVRDARADCENGTDARRRSGAMTLEPMRVIYGWWAQTKLSANQWEELQKQGPPWLNWWSPQDEVTTTLCSLATDWIDSEEAKRRLARVLELPEGGGLCYSAQAQSELWQAGTRNHSWLRDMAREKCPPELRRRLPGDIQSSG